MRFDVGKIYLNAGLSRLLFLVVVLDTSFCVVDEFGCVLLFVELVVAVVVILLLCELRGVRGVVPRRGPLGGALTGGCPSPSVGVSSAALSAAWCFIQCPPCLSQ